jgi:ribosomal 30S subunit maturation factor RimM
LIGELTQLLAECDEEYKKNVIGCEVFNSSNTGLGQVNGEMKGHHDYEIKQTSII